MISADLCNNDINNTNRNNTTDSNDTSKVSSISPSASPTGQVDRTSPAAVNTRKRRRSSSSCASRSRSNSPSSNTGGSGHDLSRKGMMTTNMVIKQEEPSPRNSPPSCHSCCCQKSPTREDEERKSPNFISRQTSATKSNSNDCSTKIESGEDGVNDGGHPSLTVDNGLSSPGSTSSTSSSNGRPPSRPPSTASTASSSCFSSVLSLSTSTTTSRSSLYNNHYNHLHHHNGHHSHHLKFSIEDILRPDFGKVRNATINSNGLKSNNSANNGMHQHAHQNGASPNKKPALPTHSSSEPTRPNSRASSFKYHSDDSNCSSTSRVTEVVDDTKINPPVPEGPLLWPAWVYCTRYSDRPSSEHKVHKFALPYVSLFLSFLFAAAQGPFSPH
ncbi:Homeobox protein engrailed [Orchesella cincta]|uniref:Homeobox protein engrailed n=1 Tax=Orchesella cincta TaxID=48709 RepID=A0A1D2NBM5_ORCCI|nr:Homeobox protein engrailed [Orchesella cincta]